MQVHQHITVKTCNRCGTSKPLNAFYVDRSCRDGKQGSCKQCLNAQRLVQYHEHHDSEMARARRWRSDNPNKVREYSRRYYKKNPYEPWLRNRYGLTGDDYARLYEAQNSGCAICGADHEPTRRLSVDHDHDTGVVRGLLCSGCNAGLGGLQDNPDLLIKAAVYLSVTREHGPACEIEQLRPAQSRPSR